MLDPRPGFVQIKDYLSLPREHETWLLKPLIPQTGVALLYGAEKLGKALALDTPIPTPQGWCLMEELVPGMEVFGSDGQPCRVLATTPVMNGRPCFAVTFGDGSRIIADAWHEWAVIHSYGPNRVRKIVTTQAMYEAGTGKPAGKKGYTKYAWQVPTLSAPMVFPAQTAELPLDPYCFGAWLGDGTSSNSGFCTADTEMPAFWAARGWELHKQPSNAYGYGIYHTSGKEGCWLNGLKQLGVLNNKHIPQVYLHASIDARVALLRGLMDTDGSCEGGTPTFWNTNRQLAQDVQQLALSLGMRVKWHEKPAMLQGVSHGTCYSVSIRSTLCPFQLPRKAAQVTPDHQGFWSIVAIEPVESVPVKCIMVDAPDHLYLAGPNCIPTHNSYLGIQLAQAIADENVPDFLGFPIAHHGKVLYLQLDTPRSLWSHRFVELIQKGGVDQHAKLFLADRESIDRYPFDILQPQHMAYLHEIVQEHDPVCVIVDTLRECHSGDEDSSTTMRNVISNLVGATHPAALILISHSRKPSMDGGHNLMADHRGSSYTTGRMDAILRLTKNKLSYTGRSIEEGDIKLQRGDDGLWSPNVAELEPSIQKVMADPRLESMRSKAKALALLVGKTEDACMSILRRWVPPTAKASIMTSKGAVSAASSIDRILAIANGPAPAGVGPALPQVEVHIEGGDTPVSPEEPRS